MTETQKEIKDTEAAPLGVTVKRLVSVVCSTLIGFLAFMVVWCGAGMTMDNFVPTLHPGWWMALGYSAGTGGIILFEIVSRKVQAMIEH